MRSVEFKYSIYKGTKSPIIPLEVKGKSKWQLIWAYVDSGAANSIFSSEEAGALGLKLSQGRRIFMVVGDGGYIPVYLFKLPLKIWEMKITATIDFSKKLGVGFNLLGRKDIFKEFRVCFDDKKGVVSFNLI